MIPCSQRRDRLCLAIILYILSFSHLGGYPTGGVTPGLTTAGTLPPTADDSMLSATGSVFSGTDGGTFRHPVRRNPSRRSKKDSVARLAYTGLTHIVSQPLFYFGWPFFTSKPICCPKFQKLKLFMCHLLLTYDYI